MSRHRPHSNYHRIVMPALLALASTLAACGGGHSSSASAYMAPATPAAPNVTLSLSSSTITLGQSATLTWSSTGATACTASGAWSGTQAVSGTLAVTPTAAGSATYMLTCTGTSGSTPQTASLTVTGPSSGPYTVTDLVADTAGTTALAVDPNLINPWGLVMAPSAPVWVSNNGTQTSTLYNGNGIAQPAGNPLVVKFPASFGPTGVVANAGTNFVVSAGGKTGAATFIYAGESGMIAGWSSSVDPVNAVTAYTDTDGAVYTGLAIAANATGTFLYAADLHGNKIDVFNATFQKQTPSATSFAFADPALPAGYAPFAIQALATGANGNVQLYVAYAQQKAPDNRSTAIGAGLGLIDIFDTNGVLVTHLIPTGGALNSPWGMALAPKDFGALSNDLLFGNLGDGTINAYDPASGKFIAALSDGQGKAVAISGLWGIAFGNDSDNQPHNTLFFAAGPNGGAGGTYGRVDVGSAAPTLNEAPLVTITAPVATVTGGGYGGGGTTTSFSGTVTVTATATSPDGAAITQVQFFADGTSLGTTNTSPYSIQWDTTKSANGSVSLTATASDANGNVGASSGDTVSVANAAAAAPAATLSQLQATIFGPICSVCHNGVGTSLPGVQNLTSAAATYQSFVGVASIEQPALDRVNPGNATMSYVIEKLEGASTISGSRMPLGGPYLTSAQISEVSSWIAAGAPND